MADAPAFLRDPLAARVFAHGHATSYELGLRLHSQVDSRRHRDFPQILHRPGTGLGDIYQPLVRSELELLPRFLIDVRRSIHRVSLDTRRKGDGTTYSRPGALRRFDDLSRSRVEDAVIVRLHPDPNFHRFFLVRPQKAETPAPSGRTPLWFRQRPLDARSTASTSPRAGQRTLEQQTTHGGKPSRGRFAATHTPKKKSPSVA